MVVLLKIDWRRTKEEGCYNNPGRVPAHSWARVAARAVGTSGKIPHTCKSLS